MTHQAAASSSEERLKQLMQTLDTFCDESSGKELQTLANEAKTIVAKMQNVLERSLVEHLAKLVRDKQWDKATAVLTHHFTLDQCVGRVEEVLVLVGVHVDGLACAINWVDKLDVLLKIRAYEALHEQFKFKKFNNQPQVLLLWNKVGNLPGGVLDSVRDELDKDFQRIVELIIVGIKKNDYSLSRKIYAISLGNQQIMNELVAAVLQKYDTFDLENTLLLIQYSFELPMIGNCCFLIDTLFKALASRELLNSEQAMHLYAHAKYTMEEQANWKQVSPMVQKLCTDVLDKLAKEKPSFFQIYQTFVEDKDEKKIQQLHIKNRELKFILPEFVNWYYKKEDLGRVQKLLSVVKVVGLVSVAQTMLTELHSQMSKFQQLNTFEAFCLFNELKLLGSEQNYKNYATHAPRGKEVLEQLKSKAPSCLQLLLWPRGEKLQVVNKFFDLPLSIDNDAVVCCESRSAEGSTSVDRDSAMTTFSFNNGVKCWKLDADALEDSATKQPWTGTQWKLKAVDDTHLKIYTKDGKFLTAEEPCRNDKSKRVVCLKRENSTGMQLWKIEPAKKMKIEYASARH